MFVVTPCSHFNSTISLWIGCFNFITFACDNLLFQDNTSSPILISSMFLEVPSANLTCVPAIKQNKKDLI